ncbi:uncharacterized protein LOC106173891 [Lingula anatina]|uniref:Uncharacterized protein LOC106173891 n=1 Tax=Lingula anatina TaxID=7574 RepID=A0A1S3JKL9_LINAN|nr:uncharacterized protein LOC106173891 [Lingula anatina]|eukprot:XP_013410671.1 uncharacterized protein LOC106173891 [Lingula anatina]
MALYWERSCFCISGLFLQVLMLFPSLMVILGQNTTTVSTNSNNVTVDQQNDTLFDNSTVTVDISGNSTVAPDNGTWGAGMIGQKNDTKLQKLTDGGMSTGTVTTISVLATLAIVVLVIVAGLLIYTKGKLFILCRRRSANVSPHERLEEQAAEGTQQEQEQVPDSVAQIEPQLRQEGTG